MTPRAPDWDLEQLEIIMEAPATWQLVTAGPGAGKSAVACQRIAYLVDQGIPATRMLLISFTRTAVAELRARIVSYAMAGERARSVRISTIDSHAWSLRVGFDDEALSTSIGDGSYELSIERTVELFRKKQPDLWDFMSRLEHLIIDEAQDVIGVRADLIIEMLRCLPPTAGVTILADPAQAIYGFTTEGDDCALPEVPLLARLDRESGRPLLQRALKRIHRIEKSGTGLVDLFSRTRKEIELADQAGGHVARIQTTIRETCGEDVGVKSYKGLAEFLTRVTGESMLVLFRRRADVLFASSYCSEVEVQHRLRMSDLPVVVRPWLGWLLGEYTRPFLGREDFDRQWAARAALVSAPLATESRDDAWEVLHRLAAGSRPKTIDLVHLRNVVSRSRPPVELCYPELGVTGPILGTIHASKGREADTVVLVMPSPSECGADDTDAAAIFEEGRVYYVGATRARKLLVAAANRGTSVGYLSSKRVYRGFGPMKAQAQLEIGRDGDVDRTSHLGWSTALRAQSVLAECAGRVVPLKARAIEHEGYVFRLEFEHKGADGITRAIDVGQLGNALKQDLGQLWGIVENLVDRKGRLKPFPIIPHLHMVAVGTVGLTESERNAVKAPFNQSGFALAPVVKGFPTIPFVRRYGGGVE